MSVQVTITTTPTLITGAKAPNQRGWILIQNPAGGQDVAIGIGDAAVTMATGTRLIPGAVMNISNEPLAKPAALAIYGRVASGTQTITVQEGA